MKSTWLPRSRGFTPFLVAITISPVKRLFYLPDLLWNSLTLHTKIQIPIDIEIVEIVPHKGLISKLRGHELIEESNNLIAIHRTV